MKDVFISYKAEEAEDANWVKSVLETNGLSCWMAPACIPGGSNYAMEIPRAIRGCKVFVLLLSDRSQSSMWVSKEVDCAINYGKVILPFMLENCALKEEFNFYLTNVQRYAAFENKSAAIKRMILDIRAIISNAGEAAPVDIPAPAPAPAPASAPARTAGKLSVGMIAGYILAVINAFVCLWGVTDPYDFSDGIFFFLPLAAASIIVSALQLLRMKEKRSGAVATQLFLCILCLLVGILCLAYNIYILKWAF